jgi:ABC-type nitrate/sulfonate/bicarbonate transport system substrate-binding protein
MTPRKDKKSRRLRAVCLALTLACAPALCAAQKITIGTPGIPPIFGAVIFLVADKEGFFKKRGAEVTVRGFETGSFATRAVVAGEIELALGPSPLVVSQIANTGVPLVGVWGMENPDWLLGSTDPNASCAGIKGQAVGVDAVGGARSIALKNMLIGGCKMKIEDVQQVALGSQTAAAMIAGQLRYGALHIDDVPTIEAQSGQGQAGAEPRRVRAHRGRAGRRRALHARPGQRRQGRAGRRPYGPAARVREEVPQGISRDRVLAARARRAGARPPGGRG